MLLYVGKLENLTSDIDCLLKNFSNDSLIHNVKTLTLKKINSAGTHTKAINRQYFSQLPYETIVTLLNIFKDDLIIGDYKCPKDYIDFCPVVDHF